MIEAILALIEAALAATPEIIADVENLVSKAKQVQTGDFSTTPLEPQIAAETQSVEDKLNGK